MRGEKGEGSRMKRRNRVRRGEGGEERELTKEETRRKRKEERAGEEGR